MESEIEKAEPVFKSSLETNWLPLFSRLLRFLNRTLTILYEHKSLLEKRVHFEQKLVNRRARAEKTNS